ncbi:putative bifunctional diguanylate cyclase/phosphodiesterase [Paracoccus laeviglucosivorans]|uniref:putative bifunctional diguanylate cyclase/phosphodiesterase n=1 Tax=Paracoccus laeviglucosivorans TaxID=1197861 RepID=UPI0011570AF2|nr:EAL domain-containing protein [Paracoccus laeviglucosivorans]
MGAASAWSETLSLAVRQMVEAPIPVCIAIGPQQRLIYNPGFAALIGALHPRQFGEGLDRLNALLTERLFQATRFPLPDESEAAVFFVWDQDGETPATPPPGSDSAILPDALRVAAQDNRLCVHYQPQVRLTDGAVVGLEALARWRHPTLGNVAPDIFIPLAERTAQIGRLGVWILGRSLLDFASLGLPEPMRLAVNVSPLQLRDPGFADQVARCLDDAGQIPKRLELEITETTQLGDDPQVAHALKALEKLGVGLALDDFGTGYSNFAALTKFRFSCLKLDRTLVTGLDDERNQMLIRSMVGMAQNLEMDLLAEGIETEAQANILRDLGCELAQGYLFSPPLPFGEIRDWLDAR